MKKQELQKTYKACCERYALLFAKKQGLEFNSWVGNKVGELGTFGDFYFNLSDIIEDIDNNHKKGLIIKWYYDNLDNPDNYINYYSYLKGFRHSHIKKATK